MSVRNLISRGLVALVNAAGRAQRVQVRLLAGEVKDNVEHLEPFGFTSHPLPGAEHVTLFPNGDRSHAVTIVIADRRYRLQALPAGGVALYDASGSAVTLSADGEISVQCATRVRLVAPLVVVEGDLQVTGNVTAAGNIADQGGAKSMAGMRADYNAHRHGGGAVTDRPM